MSDFATHNHNKTYDPSNIFAKIISGTLPSNKVYEDELCLAFHDINPRAQTHVLVIPKGEYIDFSHFIVNASAQDISQFFGKIEHIATNVLGLQSFRLNVHNGESSGQEVFHFHVHILSN